jgi:hypothetical protein
MHCPEEGLQNLEEISYLLKNKNSIDMSTYLNTSGFMKPYSSGSVYISQD